jgi:hypothetical protein
VLAGEEPDLTLRLWTDPSTRPGVIRQAVFLLPLGLIGSCLTLIGSSRSLLLDQVPPIVSYVQEIFCTAVGCARASDMFSDLCSAISL